MISAHNIIAKIRKLCLLAVGLYFSTNLCLPLFVVAGEWRVNPIKLSFDAKTRSDVITIINEGDQNLVLEVTAMAWSQNTEGQDIYEPATDLIYFPKQLTVLPNKERVIRTGVKVPAVEREKTYRLFIREIPDLSQNASNTVAIAIQFGVPVFVKPAREETSGAIIALQQETGIFSARLENQGNSHFRVNKIIVTGLSTAGEKQFTKQLNGWYLLNNRSRTFEVSLPKETCKQIKSLDILVQGDKIELNERVDVDPTLCQEP